MVYAVIGVLCAVIVGLLIKIHLLRKSAREIAAAFAEKLRTDTNTLISVSNRDKYMLALASQINDQLRELRKQRHKFTQGDAELKAAITNISHDLRTPLTAICGYLELLERADKSPEVSRYFDIISERAELMKSLTEELFRYSVILADSADEEKEDIAVNRVLEDCIMGFYAALSERGITPVVSIPETDVIRRANKASLSRIFSNIISNAIKYSDGDLTITMKEDCTITFANTAKSLTTVQVERLFDRFYTVEVARNSTGLGLSIARTLAERMGGSISAVYEGDVLTITVSPENVSDKKNVSF